jgi:hypothetical protein
MAVGARAQNFIQITGKFLAPFAAMETPILAAKMQNVLVVEDIHAWCTQVNLSFCGQYTLRLFQTALCG